MLDEIATGILLSLRRADGASFSELITIAGLDPARDLRGADLSGIDFAGCDLAGYDFSGANLSDASFQQALIDHAVFDRADLSGVVWPHGWRPDQNYRMRHFVSRNLHPRQREIAKALQEALRAEPPAHAFAIMPAGVSRTAILKEVLVDLMRLKAFRRGVVLTETIAERNQITEVLSEAGLPIFDADQVRKRANIGGTILLVETFGNLSRLRADVELEIYNRTNLFDITHIVFMSIPSPRRKDIVALTKALTVRATLAFSDTEVLGPGRDKRMMREQLGLLIGQVSYCYNVKQAVEDGLLTESEIINRGTVITSLRDHGGGPDTRTAILLERISSDFFQELEHLVDGRSAMLIVPDVEMVKEMADELRWIVTEHTAQYEVVALTTKVGRLDMQPSLCKSGTLIVTTPMMADTLDLRNFSLVGVLARLPRRLSALLKNPAATSVRQSPLRVVDYVEEMAATKTVTRLALQILDASGARARQQFKAAQRRQV